MCIGVSDVGFLAQCPSVTPLCVDLADWGATEATLQDVGPIDLLVNNAACTSLQPFLDVTPDQFDQLGKICNTFMVSNQHNAEKCFTLTRPLLFSLISGYSM